MTRIEPNQQFKAASNASDSELEALRAEVLRLRRKTDTLTLENDALRDIAFEAFVDGAKARVELKKANQEKITDQLTGALNRRGLENELAACVEGDVLLMIDLDKFKHINDTYGHAAGDEALKAVASYLVDKTREEDTVARLGGDEFVVILRGVGNSTPFLKTMELRLGLDKGVPFELAEGKLSVHGSIGKMSIDAAHTPAEILEAADRAMYQIKQSKKGVSIKPCAYKMESVLRRDM